MELLKVVDTAVPDNPTLEIDDYVPLSFRSSADATAWFYWATGTSSSLVEIGLISYAREGLPPIGAICSVTVTQIDEYVLQEILPDYGSTSFLNQLPVCDISAWLTSPSRFIEHSDLFVTTIGVSEVSVSFDANAVVDKLYRSGRVTFCVNSDSRLCEVRFTGLTSEEINIIKLTVRPT